ncbi:unnamed protein product, partial [Staurois parvus]
MWSQSAHAQVVYIGREIIFVLGRVHVISTGPIRSVQTEGQG